MDDDCEDQALVATKTCTQCVRGFKDGKSINAPLVKRGRYWCCEDCSASYGEAPHPELRQPERRPMSEIPTGVYWSREAGNFYDTKTNRGMGLSFYRRWAERKDEFPERATASAGIDLRLNKMVRPLTDR